MDSGRSTHVKRARLAVLAVVALAAGLLVVAPAAQAYQFYFGDLHAHTGYSDGAASTTPWDAYPAAIAGGADFMALTEHYSTSNAYEAWTMDAQEWADLKRAAAYYTSASFAALPAYEFYLVSHTGEINVYGVADLPPKMTFLGPDRLPLFYDWLAGRAGVGQFNHPTYVSTDFKDFAGRTAARDEGMGLIEVYNDEFYEESYVKALDAGWHVMPSANSDTHAADWITGRDMRTVLLADRLTPDALYQAMRAQRGYATLDKDLHVGFTVNGAVMGSTLGGRVSGYSAEAQIWDPDALAGRSADAVTRVEVVSDGGVVVATLVPDRAAGTRTITWRPKGLPANARYFWLRVETASDDVNGRPGVTAWTAPVWTGR
jgi:trimeric autotransporter adhesin